MMMKTCNWSSFNLVFQDILCSHCSTISIATFHGMRRWSTPNWVYQETRFLVKMFNQDDDDDDDYDDDDDDDDDDSC